VATDREEAVAMRGVVAVEAPDSAQRRGAGGPWLRAWTS
jgi:hypothetical protein